MLDLVQIKTLDTRYNNPPYEIKLIARAHSTESLIAKLVAKDLFTVAKSVSSKLHLNNRFLHIEDNYFLFNGEED